MTIYAFIVDTSVSMKQPLEPVGLGGSPLSCLEIAKAGIEHFYKVRTNRLGVEKLVGFLPSGSFPRVRRTELTRNQIKSCSLSFHTQLLVGQNRLQEDDYFLLATYDSADRAIKVT